MFHSSYVHLLEMIASQCRLPSHFYLREVAGDGSLLGGVEIEVAVVATPKRLFFWACVSAGLRCPFEEVAFLKGLYGFVIRDYKYEEMLAYRELARSAIILSASLAWSSMCVPVV